MRAVWYRYTSESVRCESGGKRKLVLYGVREKVHPGVVKKRRSKMRLAILVLVPPYLYLYHTSICDDIYVVTHMGYVTLQCIF